MSDKVHLGTDFTAEDFSDKDLTGHKFISCIFNYAKAGPETKWYGTSFHGCSFLYFNAPETVFDRCSFSHSDIKCANFKKSKFEQCAASWCDFSWATFRGADLKTFTTTSCDFHTTRIQYATINPYSRDMIGELIRVGARGDIEKLKMAAFVKSSSDLCWNDFATIANFEEYKPIAKEIYGILQSTVGESHKEIEHYKSHDMED